MMLQTYDNYLQRRARYFPQVSDAQWQDWHWQVKHRVTTVEELRRYLTLTPQEEQDIQQVLDRFRIAITPYYLCLIDPDDPGDPVRRQSIPTLAETVVGPHDMADPLDEDKDSPVP
ncbi:MAG: lysine 2,3-aminomutase, partial [Clostridiales bacterium]|nr:lysine 2,3-aminomutase [Clostridiales bacterium]